MKITLILSTLILLQFPSFSQTPTTLVDPRDGNTYEIGLIGDLYWFKSNLHYLAKDSYCATKKDDEPCVDNFYSYKTIDNVCPTGWRIPNWNEWQAAVKEYSIKNNTSLDSLEFREEGKYVERRIEGINFFEDTTHFNLKSTDMVQGKRSMYRKNEEKRVQSTIWVKPSNKPDSTTHVHMYTEGYVFHGHDHHIKAKPRKTRRFSVRCVKDVEASMGHHHTH